MKPAQRAVIGVLLATVAGAIAIVSWWLGADAPLAIATASSTPTDTGASHRSVPPAPLDRAITSSYADALTVRRAAQANDAPATPSYPAIAALVDEPPLADGIDVEVVTVDRLPVEGALVLWVDAEQVERDHLLDQLRSEQPLAAPRVRRFCTNEHGVTRVPRTLDSAYLFATATADRALAIVQATTDRPALLVLVPPLAIEARVVDEQQAPVAGVEIAIAELPDALITAPIRARTGADGIARLDDLDVRLVAPLEKALPEPLDAARYAELRRRGFYVSFPWLLPQKNAAHIELPPDPTIAPARIELTLAATNGLHLFLVRLDTSRLIKKARDGPVQIALELLATAATPLIAPLEAAFSFQLPISGDLDLGDVELTPPPLLCSGRVVDRTGEPVVGATVELRGIGWKVPLFDGKPPPLQRWSTVDENGAFALFGQAADPSLSLVARRNGLISTKLDAVVAGSTGLTLALAPGGGLEATFRTDGELSPRWFEARLRSGAAGAAPASDPRRPNKEGLLAWPLLGAGVYDFELRFTSIGADQPPLWSVPAITVAPLELTLDPRLQQIDADRLIATTRVRAFLPGGAPATVGELFVKPEARERSWRARLAAGSVLVPFMGEGTPMVLVASGFQAVLLAQIEGELDVKLEPAIAVTLVVRAAARLEAGFTPVRVAVTPVERHLRRLSLTTKASLEEGSATLALPALGRYSADVLLQKSGSTSASVNAAFEVKADGPRTIEITLEE